MFYHRLFGLFFLGLLHASLACATDPVTLDKAISFYRAEDYEEALTLLRPLAEGNDNAKISYYLGLTLKRTGDNRSALIYLQKAHTLGWRDPSIYYEIGEAALAVEDLESSLSAVQEGEEAGAPPTAMSYLQGVIYLRRGYLDRARTAFETARTGGDEIAGLAEFQLAQIHIRENRFDQARQSLQAVISLSPSSDIAAYAADYERQIAQGTQARPTWHGYAQIGYLYDDNAIAAPESDISGLSLPDEKDQGLTASLGLEYTPVLTGHKLLVARYDLRSTFYAENTSSDQLTQTVSLTPGYEGYRRALTLPISYTYSRVDNASYQQIAALKPTYNQRLGSASLLQLRAGYSYRDMLFDYANRATEKLENRDADIFSAGGGVYRFFSAGKGMASLRYEWSDDQTEGSNWEHQGHRVSLSTLLPVYKRVNGDLSAEYYDQHFDRVNSFFGVTRRDKTYSAGAGLSWEVSAPLKSYARYQFTFVDSNIDIYNYKRNTVEIGLEYRF